MVQEIERLLRQVEKPGRYAGGEYNAVRKNWDEAKVKVAFAFPDLYEVGMSHLGLQILYHIVNQRQDALLERVFAPGPDMEALLRVEGIPLFTLESRRPVREFDIFAFTLQYELTYTNVLNMMELAGVTPVAAVRGDDEPLVIGGGPCAFNPEPIAAFFDLLVIGEGEEVIHELLDVYLRARQEGKGRAGFLRDAARIAGVYVPSFYEVDYLSNGQVAGVRPLLPDIPPRVTRRVVGDLDAAPFPVRPVVPSIEAVHDRGMLEIFRGCTRGCRFCQAGIIYRPVREKSLQRLVSQGDALIRHTGYGELSLSSLSSVDYSQLCPLVDRLLPSFKPERVSVSLPSLRADAFAVGIARRLQEVRRGTLTFAPEAGTQRLRDVINKRVTREELLSAVEAAFASGWLRVKLYFMIGLPTETEADLDGITALVAEVLQVGERCGVPRSRLRVTVSAACFVPKAHTPFQWEPQATLEALREKAGEHLSAEEIYRLLRGKGIRLGMATVYRTLLILEKTGLASRIDVGNGCYRYEFAPQKGGRHHHLVCLGCGKVFEIGDSLPEWFWTALDRSEDFQVTDQSIRMFGYCRDCWQGRRRSPALPQNRKDRDQRSSKGGG